MSDGGGDVWRVVAAGGGRGGGGGGGGGGDDRRRFRLSQLQLVESSVELTFDWHPFDERCVAVGAEKNKKGRHFWYLILPTICP